MSNQGKQEPEPLWTAAEREIDTEREDMNELDYIALQKADRTVSALIEALSEATDFLSEQGYVDYAIKYSSLLDRLRDAMKQSECRHDGNTYHRIDGSTACSKCLAFLCGPGQIWRKQNPKKHDPSPEMRARLRTKLS